MNRPTSDLTSTIRTCGLKIWSARPETLSPVFLLCCWGILSIAASTSLQAASFSVSISQIETNELPLLSARFTVKDEAERPVRGLTQQETSIFIDGDQKLNFTLSPVRPNGMSLKVIFIVQNTLDMKGDTFYLAKRLVKEIVERLSPVDQVALATFNEKVNVQLDFTDEKLRLNQMLHKMSLGQGNLSIYEALMHICYYFNLTDIQGAVFVLIFNESRRGATSIIKRIIYDFQQNKLQLVGVSLNSSAPDYQYRQFLKSVGAKNFHYRQQSDIWAIYKYLDRSEITEYRVHIEETHPVDFNPHALKVVVELFGVNASGTAAYIGAPGEGINPKYHRPRYSFSASVLSFFCASLGAFLMVLILFIVEKFSQRMVFKRSAYVFVFFIGVLAGLFCARLLVYFPL